MATHGTSSSPRTTAVPVLKQRILGILAETHKRDSGTEEEYQRTFAEEGLRKAEYILDDLLRREAEGEVLTAGLVYLSVGGADGSEAERILTSTGVPRAILVESSPQAAADARKRSDRIAAEHQKTLLVVEGDVTYRLQHLSETLSAWKNHYHLTGIVCSAQAVLHELPRRSTSFDLSAFFGKIYHDPDWEAVGFYCREPCKPVGWPEVVELRVAGVSGDDLRRFALHVADRLGLAGQAEDLAENFVQMPGLLAVELLHKLLRSSTIRRLNYELGEQLTEFDPALVERILSDHVPGIRVTRKHLTTSGFEEAFKEHQVEARSAEHISLPMPITHVQITAFRGKRDGVRSRTFANVPVGDLATAKTRRVVPASGRKYTNLKSPSYSRFIPRPRQLREISDGLQERTTPVLLTGLPGAGKTSLAHEIAANCCDGTSGYPPFDAVVWLSDEGHPGSTSLAKALDEIARTLDYSGLTQLELDDKQWNVENLLRSQRVLIIVDSIQTVEDARLPEWLCNVPEPSKALVTSRGRVAGFPRDVTEVHVPAMNDEETRAFVQHRLSRLQLAHLVTDYSLLQPLLDVAKGNPKAIELGLGLIKRRRPLRGVVEDLRSAKPPFDELFKGAWDLLDGETRSLLLASRCFPYGTEEGPLKRVANIAHVEFQRCVDLLVDLGLVDLTQENLQAPPLYSTHPLVGAFVGARLTERRDLEEPLRARWLDYLKEMAASVGFCWNDIGQLRTLDNDSLRQTMQLAIDWSIDHARYEDAIALARDIRYYFYVRGLWSVDINLKRATAAAQIDDQEEEFAALVYHLNIAAKQRNLAEVERQLPRIAELSTAGARSQENMIGYQHTLALVALARGEYAEAERIWRKNLAELPRVDLPHAYSANSRWLAACLEREGRVSEARQLLRESLAHAERMGFVRGVVDIELRLAQQSVREKRFDDAAGKLASVRLRLSEVGDRLYETKYCFLAGQVKHAGGFNDEARGFYERAVDGFTRLGLSDQAAGARALLDQLSDTPRDPPAANTSGEASPPANPSEH